MPVPRRFDRRLPERDTTRINDRIRVPEVRLIGEDGNQIGVMKTPDALKYAEERDLDLVEVAPDARPPVCRVLDYSKYKYEQAQKLKAARKHQQQITIREIKFRPKIAIADYETKKGHVERFLKGKDKVKVTIMFRGREQAHPERGTALLEKLAGELSEFAIVEQTPLQDGRNMTMMLGPSKAILAEGEHPEPSTHDEHDEHEKRPRRQQREAAAHASEDFSVDAEPEQEAELEQHEAPEAEQHEAPEAEVGQGDTTEPEAERDEAPGAEQPAAAAAKPRARRSAAKADEAPAG
ncbi:MAG TPA: translation initiation factor IF-3 [Solirubrobacteraceae bacterium]|nr:translation initiation factor IF-3 [Solirubrobacteraceae bacterium]